MLDTRLPLLEKEFIEQAVRKRTYFLRAIVAAVFFGLYGAYYLGQIDSLGFGAIGSGEELFRLTVLVQYGAIFLFVPILMVGTIAYERERESLDLLELTALRGWQIILEKYFSRMIPAISLLLLVLPLHAVSLSLGGIQTQVIVNAFVVSLLMAFQVGAYAIMISAYCTSAARALLLVFVGYGVLLVYYLLDPFDVAYSALEGMFHSLVRSVDEGEIRFGWHVALIFIQLVLAWAFLRFPRFRFGALVSFIVERKQWHPTKETDVPEQAPVRWMARRRFGAKQWASSWLGRIGFAVLAVIGLFLVYGSSGAYYKRDDELLTLYLLVWGIGAMCMGTVCCNLFNHERGNQTLDVLLTTRLTPKDIIVQKAVVIGEYRWVFGCALLIMVACRWLFVNHIANDWSLHLRYLLFSFVGIWVFLNLAGWAALLIGLCIGHRMQALGVTLGILVAWNVVPLLFFLIFQGGALHPVAAVSYLSPMFTMIMIEQPASAAGHFGDGGAMIYYGMSIALGYSLLCLIRKYCVQRSEKYLYAPAAG